MVKLKVRGKWLAALALCLSCFVVCASLAANPTRAEEASDTAPKTAALSTLTPKEKLNWEGPAKHTDSKDAEHADSFKAVAKSNAKDAIAASASYDIRGKGYIKLTGKIYPAKGNAAASNLHVKIFADDGIPDGEMELLQTLSNIKPDGSVAAVDVTLSDVNDLLVIRVYNDDVSNSEASVIFTGMSFTLAEGTKPTPKASDKTVDLSTLTPKSKENWDGPATHTDNKDNARANSFKASAAINTATAAKPQAIYNLNKGYTKLTGKIANLKGNPNASDLSVSIYTSPSTKTPAFEAKNIKPDSEVVTFEADLTNAALLAFTVSGPGSATGTESILSSLIFYDLVLTQVESNPSTSGSSKYKAVENYKNLYEVLDAEGKSKSPKAYIYSTKAPEDGKEPPAQSQQALVKGETFYVCFLENSGIYLAVDKDGTLNFGNALWWGTDKQFGTTDDFITSVKEDGGYYFWQQAPGVWQIIQGIFNPVHTATATTTTTTSTAANANKYKAVEGYNKLYEVLGADGKSKNPKEYIFSDTAPADGSAPPANARKAYEKGTYFYVTIAEGSGIFLAVNKDGTPDYTKAIWWGSDKKFGTSDDFDTTVKFESGEYFWQQANGLWEKIVGAVASTTTTSSPLLTSSSSLPPKTGKEDGLHPGVAVCLALLSMGCLFCGYQMFRRRRAY